MEKLLKELKELVPFKDTTDVGDVVLVVIEEIAGATGRSPLLHYALVTGIERDQTRKDEWWEVHMQLLSVPPQPLIWTLRTEQFTGQETFTMGGKGRFVKAVHFRTKTGGPENSAPPETGKSGQDESGSGKTGGLRLIK